MVMKQDANIYVIQMPDSLSPQASKYLESVAKWFAKAEVKAQNSELSRCTDKDRFDILKPLLKELNLEKAVFDQIYVYEAQFLMIHRDSRYGGYQVTSFSRKRKDLITFSSHSTSARVESKLAGRSLCGITFYD
jgi:hypothetical protein